jgi:arabinofuranan 3-O-arabinosyltransferase
VLVNGGPDSLLPLAGQGVVTRQPAVIAGDPLSVRPSLWAVTDGQRRVATAFGLTTQNVSYTYTATETNPPDDPLGGAGRAPRQLLPVPAAGHQTVAVLSGAAQVTASSYGSWITEEPQYDPVNAFDGNPATAWAEGDPYTPAGQWIQVTFDHALDLPAVIAAQLLVDSPAREVARTVQVSTAAGQVTTTLADTGARQLLRVPPGASTWLRVTITSASNVVPGDPGAGFTGLRIPGVRVIRYLQPAEDPAGSQAASAVYSFQQQPSATAGVLARTFQAPTSQQVTMTATAVATPGAGLSRLLARLAPGGPSTFRVAASSTWYSLPRYSPDNLFTSAGAPWIASPGDPSPLLRVSWQGTRTIREIVLRPAVGTAFPASVGIVSPQGTRVADVGRGGVVRLVPPLSTTSLYVLFPGALSLSPSTTGGLPAGLSRLEIPGLAGLHVAVPASRARFQLACGQGPTVSLDGTSYDTSVAGTVADLIQSRPVRVQLCTPGGQLTLSAGQHWLLATPSSAFAVTDLDLRVLTATSPAATSPASATGQRPVQVLTWQADRRSVRIGPGAESYVEVHENFNAGWTASLNGRPLAAVRLDGWQQAFVVPAGPGGVITLAYAPAAVYHAGLIASALALAALLGLALWPGRRRGTGGGAAPARAPEASAPEPWTPEPWVLPPPGIPPDRQDEPRHWPRGRLVARVLAVLAVLAALIWLVGGPVVLAVPVLAALGWWRPRWLPWVAFGAMVVAGVTAAAGSPTAIGSGAFSAEAQAAALVALTAALMPAAIITRAGDSGGAAS